MEKTLYLLQLSSQISSSSLVKSFEIYNKTSDNHSTLRLLDTKYLDIYKKILLEGLLDQKACLKISLLRRLFNFDNKPQLFSFQKVTNEECQRILSNILVTPTINFKIGEEISFYLGQNLTEGSVLQTEGEYLIVSFSSGKNKLRVHNTKCQKR